MSDCLFSPVTPEDIPQIKSWFAADSVRKHIGIDDFAQYCRFVEDAPDYYLYAVRLTEAHTVAAITAGEVIDGVAYLMLIVDPSRQHRGIGQRVLRDVIRMTDSLFGRHCTLAAAIDESNTASIRCFESCGFRRGQPDADGVPLYYFERQSEK